MLSKTTSSGAAAMALSSLLFSQTTTAMPQPQRRSDWSIPSSLLEDPLYGAPDNDFSCTSDRNPVVMLHGLSADSQVDLNQLQYEMNARGYCTFSQTYGAHTLVPWIGGLTAMADSAVEVADFIVEVQQKTGAAKVDIVGHSEGAVQSIYAPMSQSAALSGIVGHAVGLGPAIWGAEYFGFTDLWYIGGDVTRDLAATALDVLGCPACDDMATDGAVYDYFQQNAPHVAGDGSLITIIMSEHDTLVAPSVSMVNGTAGINNVIVQDTCPDDPVGHAGLAWDKSVWRLILNALEGNDDEVYACETGLPF